LLSVVVCRWAPCNVAPRIAALAIGNENLFSRREVNDMRLIEIMVISPVGEVRFASFQRAGEREIIPAAGWVVMPAAE
jgi:hypothetical protein